MALASVRNGTTVLTAAKEYAEPERTLRCHKDGTVQNPGESRLRRYRNVQTDASENDLHDHIRGMQRTSYSVSRRMSNYCRTLCERTAKQTMRQNAVFSWVCIFLIYLFILDRFWAFCHEKIALKYYCMKTIAFSA